MRTILIFFLVVVMLGLGAHGCASFGAGGGGVSERVIQAEPAEIVEAMNRSLQRDGMELVSRSDSGDYYRLQLSAEDMADHPSFSRLAEQGDLTFNARVTRRQIEFTSTFSDTGLVAGFTIELSPVPNGGGTNARVEPVLRAGGQERDQRLVDSLNRNFGRYGEQVLESVADAVES